MNKYLIGVATAMAFALPVMASAATTITAVTVNGGPNATVPVGTSVQANVTFNITAGTDAESMSYQLVDNTGNAALPAVCIDTADHTSAGTWNVSFPVGTGGQTEGTYRIRVRSYGDNNVGADNQCNPGDLNDTFTTAEILALSSPTDSATQTSNPFNGNSNGFCALNPAFCNNINTGLTQNTGYGGFGFGTSNSIFCQLYPQLCGFASPIQTPPANNDLIVQLQAQVNCLSSVPAGTWTAGAPGTCTHAATGGAGTGVCAAFNAANVGTQPNVYSDANTALQGFLLSQHISIPALKAGASFGFYGNQTTTAVGQFRSMHPECNI